jgi:hypothetical protein
MLGGEVGMFRVGVAAVQRMRIGPRGPDEFGAVQTPVALDFAEALWSIRRY